MLKLMPTLKEGTHNGVEGAMPYDILLNEKKIGAFTKQPRTPLTSVRG